MSPEEQVKRIRPYKITEGSWSFAIFSYCSKNLRYGKPPAFGALLYTVYRLNHIVYWFNRKPKDV